MSPEFSRQWWVQRAIEDTASRRFAVTAGLGSGKTHGASDWHTQRCIRNGKSSFSFFMMPIYQKIHDAGIPTFRKVFDSYNWIEGKQYRVFKSPFPKILLPAINHEIHFISATRPDKIVAVEYSHGTISEAGSIDKEAYKLACSRVRCPKSVVRQVLCEGVTMGNTGFFAELFDSDVLPGWDTYRERDYINRERRFRRFRLTTYDNPFIPDDYIPDLLDLFAGNKNYIKAWIYGRFCPLVEGSAYASYNPELHDIEDIDPDPYREIYLTFDFNANPLSYVSNQKVAFEEYGKRIFRMVAIHEAGPGISQLDDAVVDFAAKHPAHVFNNTPIRLYGDSSGHAESHKTKRTDYQAIKKYLKELGYNRVSIEALRHNPLETASVEALNKWFQLNEHLICKRCTSYKRSLISTRWKDGVRKLDKPTGEDWTHFSDAEKYLAYATSIEQGRKVRALNR